MENREEQIKRIAASIQLLRQKAGMTQADFAEKLDYSTKAVSKWECAESVPDVFVLKKIADLFGVTVDALFDPETVCECKFSVKHETSPESDAAEADRILEELRVAPHGKTDLWGLVIPMTPKHLCITVLSVLCVWFVAVAAYVLLNLFAPGGEYWLAYVLAVPVSSIVVLVLNSVWGRRVYNQFIISILIWTVLVFVYLLVLSVFGINAWLVFLLGVPLTAALPLWNVMERNAEKKRLGKKQV